ncbi:hypothetical protein SNE40_007769 [Patella caerulea]|uniref:Uncharacterized protein n=1 Tax=Patella caerulea TaxID=87958 RepID=A0AAN8PXX2_PATCE
MCGYHIRDSKRKLKVFQYVRRGYKSKSFRKWHLLKTPRQAIINAILHNNKTYDPRIPPDFENDYPTKVTVQIYVLSFDSVNEAAMEYSMSIFLRTNWTDSRLSWSDNSKLLKRLEIDTKLMPDVWMPDIYFINEKFANIHDVTVPNRLLHIYRNGSIQSSIRISMSASCDMFLQRYPHDQQICSLRIGSYSYSSENVVYEWHSTPIIMRNGLTLPRFTVKSEGVRNNCEHNFNDNNMIVGEYTCIQIDFTLTRLFGYYIAQVYIPSVLIVILSWVSFWIDIDAIPARVSLGLLTVLTMTTQSTGARSALPRVSYIKAIDVWMSMCLVFVFAALLEFAYVNVQARVEKRRRESVLHSSSSGRTLEGFDRNGDPISLETKEITMSANKRFLYLRDKLRRQRARMADKISRVAFPIVFVAFNAIYWLIYTFYVT